MTSPLHFYLTFNPHLNNHEPGYTQGHEFHSFLETELKKDIDSYAWWGKIIAQTRESVLDISKYKDVIETNKANGFSTHLYLTDYSNIWIAKVEDVAEGIGKDKRTLEFYKDKKVEIWFKIVDFSLLTYTTDETALKLLDLYVDNGYCELKIDGLSPFTSGVRFPLIVQDMSEEMYFDEIDEDYPKLMFKFNAGLSNDSTKKVLDSLHAYVFPDFMYSKIPHAAKTEIESAELDILEKRFHNIRRNALSYIKAMEIILNDLIIGHVKRKGFGNEFYVQPETMPPKLYLDNDREGLVPISKWHKNYSITQLIYFVERCVEKGHFCFKKAFSDHKPFISFMTKDLPAILKENKILEIRGILAHNDSNSIEEKDAIVIRNLMLGLGCHGLVHQALQAFYHQEMRWMTKTQGDYKKVDFKELKKRAG